MPSDTYTPKKHAPEEMDALKIPPEKRDGCVDLYCDFKKCIGVQHNTRSALKWKSADKEYCGYYFDHWNFCREKKFHELGMSTTINGL